MLSTETEMDVARKPAYPLVKIILGRAILAAFLILLSFSGVAILALLAAIATVVWIATCRTASRELYRARLAKAAVYGLAAILGYVNLQMDLRNDEKSADTVVAALYKYQGKYGHYPQKLDELTPEFLQAIPHPSRSRFVLFAEPPDFTLLYVEIPPGGKRKYRSRSKSWERQAD